MKQLRASLPYLVNRLPADIFSRFHQAFGQRRMGMDHLCHLCHRRPDLHRQGRFMYQIGGVGSDDMSPRILPLGDSAMILNKPVVSPVACAFPNPA